MRNFRKILKTVGVFLLVAALFSVLFAETYLHGENFDYQDTAERDRLAGSVTMLISGASYTMFGIQPEILNQRLGVSCYNVAGTLLTMEGRYTLLKKELERNPVETVILEVSVDTLIRDRSKEGPEGDLPILGKLSGVRERLSYIGQAFSISEYPMVYYDLVSKGMESVWLAVTGKFHKNNTEMKLGFLPVKKESYKLPDNYGEIFHSAALTEQIVPENAQGLERLIALCRANDANVILVVTPKSQYYNCMYSNLDVFDNWFRDFAEQHGVRYLNFNLEKDKLSLLPDRGSYYDEAHLNGHGSEVFTGMLAERISDIQQGVDYQNLFYSSYSELEAKSSFSPD